MGQLEQDVADIKRAIIGDDKMGIPGLVKRQEADEEWQKKVDKNLLENNRLLNEHTTKLNVIYPIFAIVQYVGQAKKQIIIIGGAIGSLLLLVYHKFEEFLGLINKH